MAAASGIWNHAVAASNPLTTAKPMSGATSGSGSTTSTTSTTSSSDSATISANDFLTLLVTEMQNQDPTADTDPNEYINQLVQVNSLEQLIDINQNVSTALGDTSATTTSGSAPKSGTTNQAQNAASMTNTASSAANSVAQTQPASSAHTAAMATAARSAAANVAAAMQGSGAKSIPGNLSIPSATAASRKVAEALNGRPRVQ